MSYTINGDCTGCTACVKVCPVDAIRGERGSLHLINPQICISCGACGRVCPAAAVLDDAGEVCVMLKRSQWLKPVVMDERCVSCGACLEACPTSVIDWRVRSDHQVRLLPVLADERNCIGCSFCALACPTEAIRMQ